MSVRLKIRNQSYASFFMQCIKDTAKFAYFKQNWKNFRFFSIYGLKFLKKWIHLGAYRYN